MADTVDHFVPKSHCALRTFHWPNLLLACFTCNTRFKVDKHRGDGLVGSLLIDPTREDPLRALGSWSRQRRLPARRRLTEG